VGATTTVTIDWNTAQSSIGTHTLTAHHDLADDDASNDQGSTTVTVTDPGGPGPVTDLAVINVAAVPELVQGNIAGVNVTVSNLGDQDVGTSFNVILDDDTDGVTVGSKSVAGLAAGATTTVTIDWNTATSSLGLHTLTAHHDFADEDPSNDQGSTTVRVNDSSGNSPVTDVAVTSVSTPASPVQGDIAPVNVTVENVGTEDVGATFTVTLVDDTDGVTVGSQSVAGLVAGATTTVTIDWNTAQSSIGTHTLTAQHDLADEDASNDQSSTIVTVNDPGGPPPVTDLAVTSVAAVPELVQGNIAGVNVTVENVGNQDVGATFTVTVVDATDGVTVGSKSVAGLAVGATTTVTIDWNTAQSSLGLHTLTGRHDHPDADASNDEGSTTVRVNDPGGGSPVTDVAVTSVSTPASPVQGDIAPVNVTVENVGNQDVGATFTVTLVDDTDGVTVGSQSVAGLAAGATTTVTIDWNTAQSSIGTHTLTAQHDLADEDTSNDQSSTIVTVNDPGGPPPVTDLAITNVAAVPQLVQGNIAGVNVTVANVGDQDVGTTFSVTVMDDTDGVTVGSKSVAGLAVGATTTVTIDWNTAQSSIGTHTLTAHHDLADDDASNDQGSTTVTVTDPSPPAEIHVGDLDGLASNDGRTWSGTVEITVHDGNHTPVDGAYVAGTWSESAVVTQYCTTSGGTCIVTFAGLRKKVGSITFTVTTAALAGQTYVAGQNHDADGSSNGTSVTVNKP
jgi:subtilase family serine protease